MLLIEVVRASERISAARGRNDKTAIAAETLTASGDESAVVSAYLAGALPQRRTGIGWRTLQEVRPMPALEPRLTVAEVDRRMQALEQLGGPGSAGRRRADLADLLAACTAAEQDFVRGLVTGELRQGASEGVLQNALAEAAQVRLASVRRAVMLAGELSAVAPIALAEGEQGLAAVALVPGRPLRPMLAGSAATVAEAMAGPDSAVRIDRKLDGIRIQAHKVGDQVRLFTRSLDEVTARLPEVVEMVAALPVQDAVLDGEVIALDAGGRPLPFQVTGARTASQGDPAVLRQQTPVTAWFFDLLHLDGQDLVDQPLAERAERLSALLPQPARLSAITTDDPQQAAEFFADTIASGHEGVVLKHLDRPYEAGRRGSGWIKVKPRHTLDLVVLAVERGSGRRSEWLSNIHLGARDPDSGELVMLGKTFKGMTDEMLRWQTQRFTELAVADDGWTLTLRPEQVVEVAFDGIQRSRRYRSGMALRFARVLRYRDDKTAQEADTIDQVRRLAGW
ncbi:ATP-dependent DNA ligase [Dermacoccaceae bacterium W4C1]